MERPCRSIIDEKVLAKELKLPASLVFNVQRQIRNQLKIRKA